MAFHSMHSKMWLGKKQYVICCIVRTDFNGASPTALGESDTFTLPRCSTVLLAFFVLKGVPAVILTLRHLNQFVE